MTPSLLNQFAAYGVGLLLLLAPLGMLVSRRSYGSRLIYGSCALVCSALAGVALYALLVPGSGPAAVELPIGIPLGRTQLAFDPLSAAFAVIVNLTTAIVSVYAVGYGAHANEPQRVVPFYPAFIAAMNIVLLSQDAFSFLVGWEIMSLASWALVVSEDRSVGNRRAALVYLIMATGGAMALLLAFGILAGPEGGYSFDTMRQAAAFRPDCHRARAGATRGRVQGRPGSAARVATAGASGSTQPCLGVDEQCHDQSGGVWIHPDRL